MKEKKPITKKKRIIRVIVLTLVSCFLLALIVPLIEIPMVKIKSIYLSIESNNDLLIEAPFWALFYKSMAKAKCSLSYDDTTVKLKIEDVRIRELSSKKGIVKSILDEDTIEDIEASLKEAGIEISMWKEDYYIYAEMTNLDIVKTIINTTKGEGVGFLTAALVAGTLNSNSIEKHAIIFYFLEFHDSKF